MPERNESDNPGGQALGVILCPCRGAVGGKINLEQVGEFLNKSYPGVRIHVVEQLCERPESVARIIQEGGLNRLVIGACGQEEYQETFQSQAKKAGLDPFGLEVVDLRYPTYVGPDQSASGQTIATEKTKLLMAAALERALAFKGADPESLRPRFGKRDGKLSRRAFFSIPRIRYQIIPNLDKGRCFADMGCRLCLAACPYGAIGKEDGAVFIDKTHCEGCGLCVPVCPRDAIEFPTFTPAQIDRAMKALLSFPEVEVGPRVIMFICPGSKAALADMGTKGFAGPPGLLPLELPCMGMLSPAMSLKAIALGAASVILLPCPGRCPHSLDLDAFGRQVAFLQTLLESLGHGKQQIHMIHSSPRDHEGLAQELTKAEAKAGALIPFESVPWEEDKSDFGDLVLALNDKIELSIRSLECPLGLVRVDPEKCTACGLCAAHCPTAALVFQETDAGAILTFSHRACTGCGICVTYCPEQGAIQVEKGLELEELRTPARVLLADEMARCPACGRPSIPQRMAKKIEQTLLKGEGAEGLARVARYCPDCRIMAPLPPSAQSS